MSKFKTFKEESRVDYGSNDGFSVEQLQLGAILRIADGIEKTNRLLESSRWCSVRSAIVKIADRGITIRHEHSLTFKLHWSIRWPWQQKAKRRQWTWRLFKKKAKGAVA